MDFTRFMNKFNEIERQLSPTSALRLSFDNISPESEEPPDGNKRLWGVPVPPFVSEKVVSWIEEEFNEAPVFYNGNSVLKKVYLTPIYANQVEENPTNFPFYALPPASGRKICKSAICLGVPKVLPPRKTFPIWVMYMEEPVLAILTASGRHVRHHNPITPFGHPQCLTDCCIVSRTLESGARAINGMAFPSKSQMQLPPGGKLFSYIKYSHRELLFNN